MNGHIRFLLATAVLSICIVFVYRNILIGSNDLYKPKKAFPFHIASWTGSEAAYDKEMIQRSLSPDAIVYNSYSIQDGSPPITVFIGYYGSLEKADLSHSPIVCFTGQGWQIERKSQIEIPINHPDLRSIEVKQLIQNKYGTRMITLFWYQSSNRTFSNRGLQKLFLFYKKLIGERNDSAFVRLTVIVPPENSIEAIQAYLCSFVQSFYSELNQFFL